MRGRKPSPPHLKLVKGSFNVTRDRDKLAHPVVAEGDLPPAPAHFSPEQREVWDYYVRAAPKDLLRKADLGVLMVMCVAEAMHRQASAFIGRGGVQALIYTTPKGVMVPSPLVRVVNSQAAIVIKAAAELGLTPVSRIRSSGEQRRRDDGDPLDEFFGPPG